MIKNRGYSFIVFAYNLFTYYGLESPKIESIQGLRGIAILGVLVFHLWSNQVKNGEFGVDIFFVISGFLMATLLTKELPSDRNKILDFYYRRIKRILPMYLLIIALCLLIFIIYFVHPLEYTSILDEIRPALVFLANLNWKQGNFASNYLLWVCFLNLNFINHKLFLECQSIYVLFAFMEFIGKDRH